MAKYFGGSESHNTVMLGDNDQMLKGGRFIWYYWPINASASLKEQEKSFVFDGCVNVFRQLGQQIFHQRRVEKKKGQPCWVITDVIEGALADVLKRQLWHTDSELQIDTDATITEKEGWVSDYYGVKRSVRQKEVQTLSNKIVTTITVKE